MQGRYPAVAEHQYVLQWSASLLKKERAKDEVNCWRSYRKCKGYLLWQVVAFRRRIN